MTRILTIRLIRTLRENLLRYLALTLLIIMGMFIVVGIVASADSVILGTKQMAKDNNLEDGEFTVFIPLSNAVKKDITDKDVDLEENFYFDIETEDGITIRVMKNRESINKIALDEGNEAKSDSTAVIEKRFAKENSYELGDKLVLANKEFEIVGIGSTADYDLPVKNVSDVAAENKTFGIIFVTADQYDSLIEQNHSFIQNYIYSYKINGDFSADDLKDYLKECEFNYEDVKDVFYQDTIAEKLKPKNDFLDGIDELKDGAKELNEGLSKISEASQYFMLTKEYEESLQEAYEGSNELLNGVNELEDETVWAIDDIIDLDLNNLLSFTKADDNARIFAVADDVELDKNIGLVAGVIVIVLVTYVISVFIVHQIQSESSIIGTLYAMGVKKEQLMLHYIALPVIVSFVGGIIGTVVGFSQYGAGNQMQTQYEYFSIPVLDIAHPIYLLVYGILMPPVVAAIVNAIVVNEKLSQTALSLIKNEQKEGHFARINLKCKSFIKEFQLRQLLREARSCFAVILGIFISLLIFTLGLDCFMLCTHIQQEMKNDTNYQYMYTLKYPQSIEYENGEKVFSKSLIKEDQGYAINVVVMGIDDDNKYFEVTVEAGESSIVISKSVQQKYGLKEGDYFNLSDVSNNKDYAFKVKGVANYSAGLMVFMDINSMRSLFEEDEDYYNTVLSDEPLDIQTGRIYSITTKAEIDKAADVFVKLYTPLSRTLIGASIIVFCVVMYLMSNVMIERASYGISLVKIFGYRNKEVQKVYLTGNFYIVVLGSIICIPLAKLLADGVYPSLITNVSCGINLHFEWYFFVIIFAGIVCIYSIISMLIVRKISCFSYVEVLKNRE